MKEKYQICKRCIMDTTDPKITFDENGICTHCRRYDKQKKIELESGKYTKENLNKIIKEIKNQGKDKKYDCLIGLSGGVDSSYLAYCVKQWGVRPLCMHMDNGWDTELSIKNIEQIIRKLKFDLYTYVLDWEEFKDLQLAYLKAGVIDLEIPTDHAIFSALYYVADKFDIKSILYAGNRFTECTMPFSWNFTGKYDVLNILAIHYYYGTKKLYYYPFLDEYKIIQYKEKGIKTFSPLNYMDFNFDEIKKLLEEKLNWKYYGGKHFESFFTRFYQQYILPVRFNVDKRRAHLSDLINAGQINREKALEEINKTLMDDKKNKEDKKYFCKKLGITEEEFENFMRLPKRSHFEFLCNSQPKK